MLRRTGRFEGEARETFSQIIQRLRDEGSDAVALVCAEIPIQIGQADSVLPTLDSTRLLAKAAVDVALDSAPFPTCRGGRLR